MGVRDFAISTNHPFNCYQPGQSIRGRLRFKTDSTMTIRGVYVKFKGVAKTSWQEKTSTKVRNNNVSTHTTYSGEREYFHEGVYVLGEKNGNSFELPPGEHEYKFQYNLPVGLPTSFEGPFGHIRYTITGVVDIPWRIDATEEVRLEIATPVDLNAKQILRNPGRVIKSKHLCCLWCRSGPITMELHIPKTGFTQAEPIPIRLDVENLSSSGISEINCRIEQIISYYSESPSRHTKTSTEAFCRKRLDGVPSRSVQSYTDKLILPNSPVLDFTNCDLLKIEYKLHVQLSIEGFHMDLSGEIPMQLGSIPLRMEQLIAPPVSILTGLGSPYPYEGQQVILAERSTANVLNEYGWCTNLGKVLV